MNTDPIFGQDLIAAERVRQREEEGYTLADDACYQPGELSRAGRCYISIANVQLRGEMRPTDYSVPLIGWPWQASAWKPSEDPKRNLVKGAALVAAELDRMTYIQLQNEERAHDIGG